VVRKVVPGLILRMATVEDAGRHRPLEGQQAEDAGFDAVLGHQVDHLHRPRLAEAVQAAFG